MTHTQTVYPNHIALRAGQKGSRPAEVGALVSVCEKSATELKQQILLKCKHTKQIEKFNVRILNRLGQLPKLTAYVLLWNPLHGLAKAGQPARTYIQQLCEN